MRIGHGFDVHQFGHGQFITLAGVNIPYDKGVIAHSDGDVVLHAIIDALLGALALGDIGTLFPDTDVSYKNADSRVLLRKVYQDIKCKGYELGNLDATIIAEKPKMQPYIPQMRVNIAEDMQVHCDRISIKATTTERLGFIGRNEGIACHVVLVVDRSIRAKALN